jgi:hypothetical protein
MHGAVIPGIINVNFVILMQMKLTPYSYESEVICNSETAPIKHYMMIWAQA